MFFIKRINLSNFNTNNVINMSYMFSKCLDQLKLKIKSQYKNFTEMAFDDDNSEDDFEHDSEDYSEDARS